MSINRRSSESSALCKINTLDDVLVMLVLVMLVLVVDVLVMLV